MRKKGGGKKKKTETKEKKEREREREENNINNNNNNNNRDFESVSDTSHSDLTACLSRTSKRISRFSIPSVSCFSLLDYLEGRPGMSDVSLLSRISGLSFDSPFLSPLWGVFCLVLLLFPYCHFSANGPFSHQPQYWFCLVCCA